METFQTKIFAAAGVANQFIQDNQSGSRQGILRGLHYQIQHTQGKLVRTIVGEIFDVAVDLRRSSPTFGKWVGTILSAQNKVQLWIPEGFAHGFFVVSEWAEIIYKATDFYAPDHERTLSWNDPTIGIQWPFAPGQEPILSEKDTKGKFFDQADLFN